MYGPTHSVFQLFGRVGTSLCMDPTIQCFNCLVEWELCYVWTQPFSFAIVWQNENFAMYGPNYLIVQLFGRVGTWICMDPAIQLFNCLGEWELGYVWTETFSLSIVRQGRGKLDIREYTQKFSFSIVSGSGNLDMYGPKHSVFQLSRGV